MVIDMRYLFIVLFFFNSFFVAIPSSADDVLPSCTGVNWQRYSKNEDLGFWQNNCINSGSHQWLETVDSDSVGKTIACHYGCTCPPPTVFNTVINNGVYTTGCIEEGDETPPEDECPSGFPPVNGECPVCVGGQNPDGTCSEETPTSSPTSTPTSTPASTPASTPNTSNPTASAPSTGGGDDDGGNPSTGGGGGGGGNGGASGSAAASSSPSGSNNTSGSNNSWTPNSGYGNWIPVDEDSNCPNKYKDNAGQWWCSGASNQGSAGSASGVCDPTATNYWSCINSGSAGSAASAGSASSDNSESKLTEKGDELIEGLKEDIDSELDDFEKGYTDDIDQFVNDGVPFENEPSAIKSLLISFLPVSSSCNPPTLRILGESIELDCEYFNLFKQWFGWFLAIVTAYQIWQMAIRPVER